jgi:predicted DCC family thiol-disulfide oxidoreductase YuxK
MNVESGPALVVYDGECIFCQNYVKLVRLREAVGKVELLDARSGDPRVAAFKRQGYDLDEGMLFVWKGRTYHGADAVHVLAGLSGDSGWFNRLNAAVFSSRAASRILYPLLKAGRRATLLVRGRKLIADSR